MTQADRRDRDLRALRQRLSRLSAASLRINESLDFDTVRQDVLDSARSRNAASPRRASSAPARPSTRPGACAEPDSRRPWPRSGWPSLVTG